MTREERKTALHVIKKFSSVWEFDEEEEKAIDNIIDELEQEPVIDKIRAEIKAVSHGKWYVGRTDGKAEEVLLMADVLQILDKYKAETENRE